MGRTSKADASMLAHMAVGRLSDWQFRTSSRQAGAVLMYHGVAEQPGDAGRSASPKLSLASFRAGLEHLRRRYDVVPARELRDRIGSRAKGRRVPVALTFDDDLESHWALAAPVLSELGLPATFFLTGSSLQAPHSFWWDDLDELFARGQSQRVEVLSAAGLGSDRFAVDAGIGMVSRTIQMMSPVRRDALARWMREIVGEPPRERGLSAGRVSDLARAGFEIGFHTRDHYHLQTVPDDALGDALTKGRDELAAAAGGPMATIAYPHTGADLRIAAAAAAAGFTLGFTGNNRPARSSDHPLIVERIDALPCSADGFEFRLARIVANG